MFSTQGSIKIQIRHFDWSTLEYFSDFYLNICEKSWQKQKRFSLEAKVEVSVFWFFIDVQYIRLYKCSNTHFDCSTPNFVLFCEKSLNKQKRFGRKSRSVRLMTIFADVYYIMLQHKTSHRHFDWSTIDVSVNVYSKLMRNHGRGRNDYLVWSKCGNARVLIFFIDVYYTVCYIKLSIYILTIIFYKLVKTIEERETLTCKQKILLSRVRIVLHMFFLSCYINRQTDISIKAYLIFLKTFIWSLLKKHQLSSRVMTSYYQIVNNAQWLFD